jgi:hypothetical protein
MQNNVLIRPDLVAFEEILPAEMDIRRLSDPRIMNSPHLLGRGCLLAGRTREGMYVTESRRFGRWFHACVDALRVINIVERDALMARGFIQSNGNRNQAEN